MKNGDNNVITNQTTNNQVSTVQPAAPQVAPAQPAPVQPVAPVAQQPKQIQSATPQVAPAQPVPVQPATPVAQQPKPVQQTAPQVAPAQPAPVQPATPVAQQPVPAQPAIQVETPPSIQIPQEPKSNNNTTKNNNDDSYQALSGVSIIDNNQDMGYTAQPEDIKEPTPTVDEEEFEEKPKKKFNLSLILLIVLLVLVGYILYSSTIHKKQIQQLNFNCTPVTSYKEEKELDVDSTLVQSLYKKVATSIREDVAQPEWNDNMKLYLAYRQILDSDKYDTNCNMFDDASMEPYTCEVSTTFIPKGFKQEVLILEWKKLFGEDTPITLTNIKLENSCVGGYQYIKEREEFVQGYCAQPTATSYKVTKKLTKAVTYRNTIILTEEVKYQGNEKMELPESLKSGNYFYTFRLDMNYNYVLVSKVYEDKYK